MLVLTLNDVGTEIEIDTDEDLTSATKTEIHVTKPSGATDTWTASVSATPEYITYTTTTGDIDEVGFYRIHAYVEWSSGLPLNGTDTVLEVVSGTASTESYLSLYWNGLKTQLDVIDTNLYTDMALSAVNTLTFFDTSFLTSSQVKQAAALLICIDCAEMPGLAGNSQDKYYSKLKIYDRTMEKDIGLDPFTGAFCRLLHITLKEFNAKTSTQRASIYTKIKSNSIFHSPDLDQRGKIYKDYGISDVRQDRESYPLDNRYL